MFLAAVAQLYPLAGSSVRSQARALLARGRGRRLGPRLALGRPRLCASFASLLALAAATTQPACHQGGQNGAGTGGAPATLVVQVSPAQGIGVLLDGRRVATTSPYVNAQLPAGSHVLEVRGMGRYPVTLPLRLAPGQRLDVPVTLRPRPPLAYVPPASGGTAQAGAAADNTAGLGSAPGPAKVRPSLSARATAPLPPGAMPLRIALRPLPARPVIIDGQEYAPGSVRLDFGRGLIQVGPMRLAYRVLAGHGVELTVPHDAAAWYLGSQQIKAKSLVRLSGSPLNLRRQDEGGEQQVVVRRLD